MTSQLKTWIIALRPKTLWACISPVCIGMLLAFTDHVFFMPAALAALLGALFIQIGTNFANDYYDDKHGVDAHRRFGPERLTQSKQLTATAMMIAFILSFTCATVCGLYLVYRGGYPIIIIGTLSLFFGLFYTAGPKPLGYIGLGDILVLIFFGPVAVAGTYYVQALTCPLYVMIAGLAPGFISTGILVVNNLRDREDDQLVGKNTLVVRFGHLFGQCEYILCILGAALIPVILLFTQKTNSWILVSLCFLIPAIQPIKSVLNDTGSVLNDTLANTGKLLMVYTFLFSLAWLIAI